MCETFRSVLPQNYEQFSDRRSITRTTTIAYIKHNNNAERKPTSGRCCDNCWLTVQLLMLTLMLMRILVIVISSIMCSYIIPFCCAALRRRSLCASTRVLLLLAQSLALCGWPATATGTTTIVDTTATEWKIWRVNGAKLLPKFRKAITITMNNNEIVYASRNSVVLVLVLVLLWISKLWSWNHITHVTHMYWCVYVQMLALESIYKHIHMYIFTMWPPKQ